MNRFLTSLVSALLLVGFFATGILTRPDQALSDAWYQQVGFSSKDNLIVGIDQESLDELGPVSSLRGAMATAIENWIKTRKAVPV